MDIRCTVCGEPWDSDLDMALWEKDLFRKGVGCPGCEGIEPTTPWEPTSISDLENGGDDEYERFSALDGRDNRPVWKRPDPVVEWSCDACGVVAQRNPDSGELEWDIPRGAKAAQWYHSHPFTRQDYADDGPAHTFTDGRKVCSYCLDHCADCDRPISSILDHDDTYSDGNSFLPEGCYHRSDAVCIDCYHNRCIDCGAREEDCSCLDDPMRAIEREYDLDDTPTRDQVMDWLISNHLDWRGVGYGTLRDNLERAYVALGYLEEIKAE
jgi:hypothetical protein